VTIESENHNEKKLDALLDDAARTYRVPPEPPLDVIWSRVEAQAFTAAPVRRPWIDWRTFGVAVAASLVIGVVMGRASVRVQNVPAAEVASGADTRETPATQAALDKAAPYQRATEEFLGSTALLLAALPRNGSADKTSSLLPEQATQLLTTTRLLLDSPVGANPRMKALLQDLELVLAQVARLQPRREKAELTMISQTLEERDLVPRIRSAVTDLSGLDY
jgi:hypothetical protein